METWLLSDVDAINLVALERGGRNIAGQKGNLEQIGNAKAVFVRALSQANLPYDAEVCRQIARHIDIERLRNRCPCFHRFEEAVLR